MWLAGKKLGTICQWQSLNLKDMLAMEEDKDPKPKERSKSMLDSPFADIR